MTVYATLESPINVTVTFHINPTSNYTVHWSNGNLTLHNTKVINTEIGEYVQTTCFISEVTKEQLGNYTVKVINQVITGEHSQVTFNVILELRGEKFGSIYVQNLLVWNIIQRNSIRYKLS